MNTRKNTPPGWATRLLRWYCAPHLVEEVEGDLLEEFDYQVQAVGLQSARLDYIRSVLGFIKPFALKRKSSSTTNSFFNMNMYKHYLLVAFRNLIRNRTFSAINVIGLALGMTCCLFIALWVYDEKSVDNFHVHGDQLYNVYQTIRTHDNVSGDYTTPVRYDTNGRYIHFADVKEVVPEVTGVSFYATGYELPWGHPETFQVGEKMYKLNGSRASEDFFTLFSYPIIAGDGKTALKEVSGIAISRKMAELFFDTPQNALGKSIRYENAIDFVVNAVFENVSAASSLQFEFLINWQSHLTRLNTASHKVLTTLQLADGADVKSVEDKLNRLLQSRLDKNEPFITELGLQPYHDYYLVANFVNGKPQGGRIEYIHLFIGVAVFILLIACINFMNLSTARSMKRAKEVGVRKVVGSSRVSLIGQFFGESILLAGLALILSIVLLYLLLPGFNVFTGKQISIPVSITSVGLLFALVIVTGLLAGSYPALFLSGLKPVSIMKGVLRFTNASVWFRKGLVTFQFVISIVLLIATIVMSQQTRFIQNTHIGYDRENLLYVGIEGELTSQNKYNLFKERVTKMPGIVMVDRSSEVPHAMSFVVDVDVDGKTETADDTDAIKWEGKEKGSSVGFKPMSVGFDFLKIMNLKIVEGRGFSTAFATDSADAFMVNEEAVKQMGMKDPIGKWVSAWNKKGHIIGILKDYNTHSLHEPIKPLIVDVKEYENFGVIMVRTEPGKTREALASLESVYKEINPNFAFAYQFLDQEYNKLYRNEDVVTKLSNAFALLSIIISCLGLLGLVIFSAEQRAREFGIRKVLGASVANIVHLLSQDFLKLVVVSFCIATPLAGYLMYQWLNGFAYRIELSWWIFALAGAIASLIALLTIGVQAIQSAVINPVNSLKAEQ